MQDDDEFDLEELSEYELFDISNAKVSYSRSKDQRRVSALIRDEHAICEMKLYLILTKECRLLEYRLGIHAEVDVSH